MASWSQVWVTAGLVINTWKYGQSSGTQPSPCGFYATSMDLVSEVNWLLRWAVDAGKLLLAETSHVWSWGQHQTHSSLSFVSGMRVRAVGLYYVGQSTQNPFPVICIFRIPGRIMYLSWSYHWHVFCPRQVICTFLSWTGGPGYMSFLKELPVMSVKSLHICGQWCPLSTKMF